MDQQQERVESLDNEKFAGFDEVSRESGVQNKLIQTSSGNGHKTIQQKEYYATNGVEGRRIGYILLIIAAVFAIFLLPFNVPTGVIIMVAIVNLIRDNQLQNTPSLIIDRRDEVLTVSGVSILFCEVISWKIKGKMLTLCYLPANAESSYHTKTLKINFNAFVEPDRAEVRAFLEKNFEQQQ